MESNRELYIFPLCHTNEEIGVETDTSNELEDAIANMATERIKKCVDGLTLIPQNTRIYHDTFPSLFSEGSRKYLLNSSSPFLRDLSNCGYTIMGTESIRLLFEQYFFSALINNNRIARIAFLEEICRRGYFKIVNQRDRFIGRRINRTLKAGETGLLFMGANHDVQRYLEDDIKYQTPEELFKGLSLDEIEIWLGRENLKGFLHL